VIVSSPFFQDHFPEVVLSPHELFLEESYAGLLRPSDEFAAKVCMTTMVIDGYRLSIGYPASFVGFSPTCPGCLVFGR